MNLNQWMATFQSPMQLAKTAHKQIADQHCEIQALKAQIERLREFAIEVRDEFPCDSGTVNALIKENPAQSLNIIKADFLDWIRQEVVLSDDVDNVGDWMLGKAFGLRQEEEENDDERMD